MYIMNILFIRGFNSDLSNTNNTLQHFETFFELSEYKLVHFNYTPDEDINDVYNRLQKQITMFNYDILMGFSLGGCLLMKLYQEHNISETKCIFLMPLITKDNLKFRLLSKIPFIKNLRLPKAVYLPNNSLYNNGNIINDSYNLISPQQIFTIYNDWIDKFDIQLLNNKNCHIIYAEDETINVISKKNLDKIKNITILPGKHEIFNDFHTEKLFFTTLKNLLNS